MKPITLLGLGINSGNPTVTAQERVNCYTETIKTGENVSRTVAYGTPGLLLFADLGINPIRGEYSYNDYGYVVQNNNFYQVANDGTYSNKGMITTLTGYVGMACNGAQLLVSDSSLTGHIYEIRSDTVVTISNASPAVVTWVSHNMPVSAGMKFTTTGGMPTGLTASTVYYIESVLDADTFTLSATQGGAAINTTSIYVGVITASTVLYPIVDADYPRLETVDFMDGYFIGNELATQKYYISGLYAGTGWNALDFASAEGSPDLLVAVKADRGAVYLLGTYTTELIANSGAEDFPFSRVGVPSDWGLMARDSVAKITGGILLLGRNKLGQAQVVMMSGSSGKAISTPDVDRLINERASLSAATAFSYMQGGHEFYQLNLSDKSFLYDATEGAWHTVESYNIGRHRADSSFLLVNKVIVSDYANGKLYVLDKGTYTDNSDPIVTKIIGSHIFNGADFISLNEIDVEMGVGVGLTSGQGSDPQIMLQISKDGGQTWGNERWTTFGMTGQYKTLVRFNRIGRAYNITVKLAISDPVPRCILAAYARAA